MKKVFIVSIFIILASAFLLRSDHSFRNQVPMVSKDLVFLSPTPLMVEKKIHGFFKIQLFDPKNKENSRLFQIYLQEIKNEKVRFIANFQKQTNSNRLFKENNCLFAINGGFYTEDKKPLGLLVVSGNEISSKKSSSLLNGYVYAQKSGELLLADVEPKGINNLEFVFQSGPLLINNGQPIGVWQDLQRARRSFLLETKDQKKFIGTVFAEEEKFNGPTLDELQKIFFEEKTIPFKTYKLINLDGGTASCFYNQKLNLEELSPIGSLLCFY